MYLLAGADICLEENLNPLWNIIGTIINIIWIGVPILLIILGSIDLGKAVIASKEDEMKKAQQTLMKRAIYAVAVFLITTLVTFAMGLVGAEDWQDCWNAAGGSVNKSGSNSVEG